MGTNIELTAADGHRFGAYEAKPMGKPRGGLVVVQEIFGVNTHIRKVADGYAADGYHVISPAIFDRAEKAVELTYGQEDIQRAIALRQKIEIDQMLADIQTAVERLRPSGKVGIVGYCLGGSLAWLSATRLKGVSAAVAYYGSMIAQYANEPPHCPVTMHFGNKDQSIPAEALAKIKAIVPANVEIFTYPAGHAFNRDGEAPYEPASAKLARERTSAFFAKQLG